MNFEIAIIVIKIYTISFFIVIVWLLAIIKISFKKTNKLSVNLDSPLRQIFTEAITINKNFEQIITELEYNKHELRKTLGVFDTKDVVKFLFKWKFIIPLILSLIALVQSHLLVH